MFFQRHCQADVCVRTTLLLSGSQWLSVKMPLRIAGASNIGSVAPFWMSTSKNRDVMVVENAGRFRGARKCLHVSGKGISQPSQAVEGPLGSLLAR